MLQKCAFDTAFYPADLQVLQDVFQRVCAERSYDPGSTDAEILAIALVTLFKSGLTSGEELLETVRRRTAAAAA